MRRRPSARILALVIAAELAVATAAAVPRQARSDAEPHVGGRDAVAQATRAEPSTTPVTAAAATPVDASSLDQVLDGNASPTSAPAPAEPHAVDRPNSSTRTLLRLRVESTAAWGFVELQGVAVMVQPRVHTTGDLQVAAVGTSTVAMALRGTGTAELTVVSEVPADATPVVVTCKSPDGDLRLRAIRDTGEPVTVAEVVHSRAVGTTSSDCEHSTRTAVTREALLGPRSWPPLMDDRRLVLGFYYPWYDDLSFTSGQWRNHPLRPWNTDRAGEVAEMVALAGSQGIDGFVVSYNNHPATVRRFNHVLTAAEGQRSFVVAPLLELGFLAHERGTDTVTSDDLTSWLRAVLERSSSRAWLRSHGRPVVFLYGRDSVTPAVWNEVRQRLRVDGLEPFVLGETVEPAFDFDGLYQYSPNVQPDRARLQAWYRDWERLARLQPRLDGTGRSVLWAAPVSPGQDDRLLGRTREQTLVVDRRGGDRYEDTWEAALETRPEWILVTSWNEFHENTEIAPSRAHGVHPLEQTSRWARRFADSG